MKRRYIIISAIVLVILAAIAWCVFTKSPGRVVNITPPNSPELQSQNIAPKRIIKPPTREEREAIIREKGMEFAEQNNSPIAYYGRVVDQEDKPLQGVAVDYTVTAIPLIPVPWGPDKTKNGSCVTDQNGLFSVEGMRGVSFSVRSLKKSGYREAGYYNQGHVRYEPYDPHRHVPFLNKPVEFMLIRDDLPRAEKAFDERLRFNWNAEITTKDFGQDIGKLEFMTKRNGMDKTNTMKQFEWEVKMHPIGFTLVELPDESIRVAPIAGYSPNIRVGFSPGDKNWSSGVKVNYALLTKGDTYGLLELTVYGDGDDGGMCGRAKVYLNKGGARNLDH